jgi:hypothetical protein
MSEGEELVAAVRRVYDINRLKVSINPEFLANGAMDIIGFDKSIHPTGWVGCNLHLRQVARAFCRRNFEPVEIAEATAVNGDLFSDDLQDRYPKHTQKGQEPEYVLRDHLGEHDRWFNIDRMRGAAGALLRHADALQTETVKTFGPRKDKAA